MIFYFSPLVSRSHRCFWSHDCIVSSRYLVIAFFNMDKFSNFSAHVGTRVTQVPFLGALKNDFGESFFVSSPFQPNCIRRSLFVTGDVSSLTAFHTLNLSRNTCDSRKAVCSTVDSTNGRSIHDSCTRERERTRWCKSFVEKNWQKKLGTKGRDIHDSCISLGAVPTSPLFHPGASLLSWSLPLCCPHIEPLGVAFFAFTLKFSFFRSCGWFFPWCCPLSRLLVTLVCDRRLFSFNLRFRFGIRIEKWSGIRRFMLEFECMGRNMHDSFDTQT